MFFLFLFVTLCFLSFFYFFFNDTATTEIYTLSLHDALPILQLAALLQLGVGRWHHLHVAEGVGIFLLLLRGQRRRDLLNRTEQHRARRDLRAAKIRHRDVAAQHAHLGGRRVARLFERAALLHHDEHLVFTGLERDRPRNPAVALHLDEIDVVPRIRRRRRRLLITVAVVAVGRRCRRRGRALIDHPDVKRRARCRQLAGIGDDRERNVG